MRHRLAIGVLVCALIAELAPATEASGGPALVSARARLSTSQATLDVLTPPAARLYELFGRTRHEVQRAGRGIALAPSMLRRFKDAVFGHRVPAGGSRLQALAFAMFEHEIVKEVLRQQNVFIESSIHEAAHVLVRLVSNLRSAGHIDDWAAVWPADPSGDPLRTCPVQGPHSLYDTFGAPRPGGRVHLGNDILAPRWTPIVAPEDGVVVRDPNTLGGNALLEYSDGVRMYFAHLTAYEAEGAVTAGTVIGYVGNSGDAKGLATHLHFQYEPNGVGPVDPYPYLQRAC